MVFSAVSSYDLIQSKFLNRLPHIHVTGLPTLVCKSESFSCSNPSLAGASIPSMPSTTARGNPDELYSVIALFQNFVFTYVWLFRNTKR